MARSKYHKQRDKAQAIPDFMEMIRESWTWEKLTEQEVEAFENMVSDLSKGHDGFKLVGNYQQRWHMLHAIYTAFLKGCRYRPIGWREES